MMIEIAVVAALVGCAYYYAWAAAPTARRAELRVDPSRESRQRGEDGCMK